MSGRVHLAPSNGTLEWPVLFLALIKSLLCLCFHVLLQQFTHIEVFCHWNTKNRIKSSAHRYFRFRRKLNGKLTLLATPVVTF